MKKTMMILALAATTLACSEAETVDNNATATDEGTAAVSGMTTETFMVYGNCGMCESNIEGALEDVEGIESGDWNKDDKQLTVSFDPAQISLDQIKQKVADVGYDSDTHRADDETYDNLHGCCQYERPEPQ